MFDRMPKILGATLGFPKTMLCTKFKVSILSNFEDTCILEGSRDLRHAIFRENSCTRSDSPRRSFVPNLKSLARVVLKICSIVCQKFQGTR